MANEAVIIELLGDGGNCIRFASTTAMSKGCLCQMTDARVASVTSGDNQPFAGILAAETASTDTFASLYTCGIFDLKDSGAGVTVGEKVSIKAANQIAKVAAADCIFSDVGVALETAGAAEVIAVAVGMYQ